MAEKAIENELNCTICLDTFTDPKILQCFHVYCQKCLVKLVMRDQWGQLSLSCPTCRQVTPVPASGTADLPPAFHVNRFLEILHQHKKAKRTDSKVCCSEHGGREVELVCETCGELICYKCVAKDSKHHSHDYTDIEKSFEKYKSEVMPLLEPMENKMTAFTETLNHLDMRCKQIAQQRKTVEAEIRESSTRLHDIINNRQDQLISQLNQITNRKLKRLAAQKENLKNVQAQLRSCLKFTKESLKTSNNQGEVLIMKADNIKQAQKLASPSQPGTFTLSTEADIVFSDSKDVAMICESYGKVYASNSPDPSQCVATGRGTEKAVVGQKTTVALAAITYEGHACSKASVSKSFQIKIVSEITEHHVKHTMEQEGHGQYVITYQPNVKGRHQLNIKADGQHTRGSPFRVIATLPVEEISTPIQILKELNSPCGVAVNEKGEVMVTEYGSHCVSVFSPKGKKLRSFGMLGSGKGQFDCPSDVAVDGEGNILVLDRGNHRIQKFKADGNFVQGVGNLGNEPLEFNLPSSITCSASSDKVYVADTENHRVQVLTPDLRFISMFGKEGSGKGEFSQPKGLATDNTGKVYVADGANHRIQVFTADGEFLMVFGKEGAGKGELKWPWGIGVDSSGLVYVSEHFNDRVSLFSSEGKFVTAIGSKNGPVYLSCPHGLAVDDSEIVYVCHSGTCVIF